jgi:hypothetical protein
MYDVVLFFRDEINLKAFQLIERISGSNVNPDKSIIVARLRMEQIQKASEKFGAVVKKISRS